MSTCREHFDLGQGFTGRYEYYDHTSYKVEVDEELPQVHGIIRLVAYLGDRSVSRLGALHQEAEDAAGYRLAGTEVITGIERTTDPQFRRRGLQMGLQDALHARHSDVPLVSVRGAFSSDAAKFRRAYMQRRGLQPKQWRLRRQSHRG